MRTEADSAAPWLRAPRLWLAGLTIAAFANATANGFVWLDHWQVESGGLIVHSWAELWRALRQPLGVMPGWEGTAPYARPCVVLLLSLVHTLAGARPAVYHLTLALLHLANVLLAYSVLATLRFDRTVAFLAAAVFAVHPLQTAAVSWVSGIADPLFTLFILLALRLQLAASSDPDHAALARVGAVLSFVFALAAKETAAVFPVLLAGTYLLFPASLTARQSARAPARGRAIVCAVAPFCIVLAAAAVYRQQVLQAAAFGRAVGAVPLSVRLWTLPRLLLSYLTLPVRLGSLSVCDDYVLSFGGDRPTLLALAAVGALCAVLIRNRRRSPPVVFGVLWMLLGLLPVLNIAPILHYRADRFFYFPLIGWSLAFVVLLRGALLALARSAVVSIEHLKLGVTLVTALGLLLLVGLTIHRNQAFADDRTLFESTLQVSPFCREARTALGDTYLRAGRYADAVAEYEQARAAQPDRVSYVVMPKVLINLGMAELGRGDYAAADAAFSEAHRLQPQLLHPLFGLGIANLGLSRVETAARWLEQAYAIAPDDPDVVLNLALSYDRLGRPTQALTMYRRYLAHAPQGQARTHAEQRVRTLGEPQP
jgi:Flp pilus assembly protein TadD